MLDPAERTVDAPLEFVAAPTTLPPAPRLGRYAVVRHIDSGGMGSVYVAYDEELHRRLAIKLLHSTGDDGGARERTLREAQALARLSHPNIVQIHDIGEFDGRVFVVMEYVDGVTLRTWRETQRPSVDAIREVYLQAGRGLAAVHAAGLCHRDFKADNAMIGADGRVRVVDFGLARFHEAGPSQDVPQDSSVQLTAVGAVIGTPAYMSPEQFRGAPADARSDQFSFCVALYEAFYGERPFAGATVAELDAAVSSGAVRPPPPGVEVPPRLHRALLRGLAPAPAARWPAMDDLLRELAVDLQADPTGSPRLRRRIIQTWIAMFLSIQAVVLAHGLVTGAPTTAAYHWIEGLLVWGLFVAARLGLRGALRAHAHHRAIFNVILIGVTWMTLARIVMYVSGASLAAMVAADLLLVGTALTVGALVVARWMIAVAGVCLVLALCVATHADDVPRAVVAIYSLLNVSMFAGWTITSWPRRARVASAREPASARSGTSTRGTIQPRHP